MIKKWSKFNEAIGVSRGLFVLEDVKKSLENHLDNIREVLMDFEDLGIIKYNASIHGKYDHIIDYYFDPKGNEDRQIDIANKEQFLDYISVQIIRNVSPFHQYKVCILAHINFPAENDMHEGPLIDSEGIKLFDDLLSANGRLIDKGYNIKLNLNIVRVDGSIYNHKPIVFKIYFQL